MNLREINKKKYEAALKAYQEQIVEIAILEYELKSLSEKKGNATSNAYDNLKARISKEYEELAVLAQAVTDTFKAFQDEEDIIAEEVNLGSLENNEFSERYYEILDRYEDELEHIERLERELTELDEKENTTPEEYMAKKKEIDSAYDALAILAADLSNEVESNYEEEFTLEDLKREIDEAIDAVKMEDTLTEEDKQIISELEIEEIERLQKEIEQYKIDLMANIKRKGELIRKDNAKEENLRGFDEAIRQIEEKIKLDEEELRYYLEKHPEMKKEEKKEKVKDVHKKGLGFEELSRYIEGYLFMKSTGEEKVHTEVENPYEDQRNISITLNLGSGYTYHYNDARNPQTGESYGYICWIAHKKDSSYILPEDFAKGADVWSAECDHIFQFRGDRKAGIQVQELELKEDGNLVALEGETEFSHIPDWFRWERDQVEKQIEKGEYFFSDEVEVHSLPRCWRFIPLGKAKLTHDMEKGFTLEGHYNGEDYRINRTPMEMNSLHIEYDYCYIKPLDCFDISTEKDSFYCYPTKQNVITKLAFATEILYLKGLEKAREKKVKS